MLDVRSFSAFYGKKQVVQDLTFSLENGSVTALLGLNGSGKTTLMRALLKNVEKTCGEVIYDTVTVRNLSLKQLAGITTYLPQILPQPKISVEDLLYMARTPFAHTPLAVHDDTLVQKALSDMNLTAKKDTLLCHLSGGERQRAYFAMVLAKDTPYVFLDEPASALDTVYKAEVYRFIKRLKSSGKTVLVTVHDLNDAVTFADHILVLEKGKLAFSGTADCFINSTVPDEIFKEKRTLKEVFSPIQDA